MSGYVSLVGAGPGDPALLTRRAAARLRRADLVLYDALVDERVLRLARQQKQHPGGHDAERHDDPDALSEPVHPTALPFMTTVALGAQRGRRRG